MALADETVLGHPDIFELFTHRFKKSVGKKNLERELNDMVEGSHALVKAIEQPMRTLIMNQLGVFRAAKPDSFDLRGASIGNLILAGGYLNQQQELEPIIFLVSKLVGVRGTVRAVVDDNLHLAAELEDGSLVIGQHLITGKEHEPLTSRIKRLFLNKKGAELKPASAKFSKRNRKMVGSADLICFPPGSFYTSVLANLLPSGVGSAIANRTVPKVFIPSLGTDPEAPGLSVVERTDILLKTLRADAGDKVRVQDLLNFVVLDKGTHKDVGAICAGLQSRGVEPILTDLVSRNSQPFYDPERVCEMLVSLT